MNNIPNNHWLINKPIAHRGLFNNSKYVIENSVQAFLNAMQKGYAIEMDLRLTKYGEVVVFHDRNIKRLTGINKKVYDLTDEDLNKIKYSDCNSKILKFVDALKIINGNVPILIELKCNKNYKFIKDLSIKVNSILREYDGEYAIHSFSPFIKTMFKNDYAGLIVPYKKRNIYFIYKILDFIFKYDFLTFNINIDNDIIKINKPKLFWVIDNETKKKKAIKNNGNIIFENIEL
jgi:glycerophosphoryl diester phosphodiesterase